MPKSKLVELARACYGAGQYDTCRHLLTNRANRIKPKKGKATFEIFFLLGKAENALGHRDEASRYLKSAIKCSKELDQSVSAKNMLQLVYAEMPNKEEQMTELFEDILARARSSDCWSPSQCMAMRTIVDFPGRYDDADELLDRALLESEGCNDEMIRPCLLTAKGLQSLRAGDTQGAQKSYAQAIGILKNVRPHEQAYLESDLGTCSMLMGDYNAALDSFRRGSAWAATPFIQKVLYSNESMCLGLLGRLEEALERVDALELFIRDEDDPLIIERIGMSILFILLLSGATVAAEPPSKRMLQFDACADAVRAVAHKSRVIERRDRYVELKGKDPQVIRREIEASPPTYHGAFFQPWAVTLHHD